MTTLDPDQPSLTPEEKLRIRMAADNYPQYSSLKNVDSDGSADFLDDDEEESSRRSGSGSSLAGYTSMEQYLCVMLIISMIAIMSLIALIVSLVNTSKENSNSKNCETVDCSILSGDLLAPMDLTADPCNDFYQFACGNYPKTVVVPPDYPKFGQFQVIDQQINSVVKKLLDDKDINTLGSPSDAVRKMKMYYRTCYNNDLLGSKEELKKLLISMTTSQVSSTWNSSWDLEQAVASAHKLDISFLFSVGVQADPKNNSVNRLSFDQGGLALSDYTSFTEDTDNTHHDILVHYYNTIQSLLDVEQDLAKTISEEAWQLQVKIAKILMKPEERILETEIYNLVTIDEVQEWLGGPTVFDLRRYLKFLLGTDLDPKHHVIVEAKPFLMKLPSILNTVTSRELANLMSLMFTQGVSRYMNDDFQRAIETLEEAILGISASTPRWRYCINEVEDIFPYALSGLYVANRFSEKDRDDAVHLAESLLQSFKEKLTQASWMDGATRSTALEKLAAVQLKIGYPELGLNVTGLDEKYDKLEVNSASSLQNYISAIRYAFNTNIEKKDKPPDKNRWSMSATEVNAYYSPTKNEMVFPAAILNKPFYARSSPGAVKYGSMGFIMGHELTHGFDNEGRLFDKEGNLFNWWTNASAEAFDKKTECLEDQYSKYEVAGKQLNGATTLGENIADNGGLRTSFAAYQEFLQKHHDELSLKLPGLSLNNFQLFFLSFAQSWCTAETPEYAQQSITTDVHSFPKYRVIGVLSNMHEFTSAYNCPTNSKMNPSHKCYIWS